MEIIMAKYGEIALKGLNRHVFEDLLVKNARMRLRPLGEYDYRRTQSTLYISPKTGEAERNIGKAASYLLTVFGIAAVQLSLSLPKDFPLILEKGLPYLEDELSGIKTFKVEARRSDKTFPMDSPALQRELGAAILERYPHLSVSVHSPEITVRIEIREKNAYLNARRLQGAGGMPLGSAGRVLALLSGGIDSPLAAYMLAKRGAAVSMVHFQTPPYTSERALMKVEGLCENLLPYLSKITLFTVNFTEISEELRTHCPEEYFTVVMRRLMVKIANKLCREHGFLCLITGESVAQVASQTLEAILCTDDAAEYPVFRPLIGMDKVEITELARKIGTYDTSVLPYEDCCTVFTPRRPKTRPSLREIRDAEANFDYTGLIDKAVLDISVKEFIL